MQRSKDAGRGRRVGWLAAMNTKAARHGAPSCCPPPTNPTNSHQAAPHLHLQQLQRDSQVFQLPLEALKQSGLAAQPRQLLQQRLRPPGLVPQVARPAGRLQVGQPPLQAGQVGHL